MFKLNRQILAIIFLLTIFAIILYGLGSTIVPLSASLVFSYISFPLIIRLERKGVKRHYAIIGFFVSFVLFFAFLTIMIVPIIVADLREFLQELPTQIRIASSRAEEFLLGFGINFKIERVELNQLIADSLSHLSTGMMKDFSHTLKSTLTNIMNWLSIVFSFFLVPLFFFFILNDYEKIRSEVRSLIPSQLRPLLTHYAKQADQILSGYIRGQMSVASILAGLYMIGLSLIGLKFGIVIGLLTGFLSIIPYVGVSIGLGISLVVAISHASGAGTILGIISIFVLIQILEGTVITPKLVGNKVGLNAISTMLAIMIGGNLLGFFGMVIAIPVAALLKVIVQDLRLTILNSSP